MTEAEEPAYRPLGPARTQAEPVGKPLAAKRLALVTGTISSSGALTLQPNASGESIGVSGGAGNFALSTAEIDLLTNGFSSITIGRSNSTALMTINADTFLDPITFLMGGVSGDITTVGALVTSNLAMTFTAGTGNSGVFTQGDGTSTIATGRWSSKCQVSR